MIKAPEKFLKKILKKESDMAKKNFFDIFRKKQSSVKAVDVPAVSKAKATRKIKPRKEKDLIKWK